MSIFLQPFLRRFTELAGAALSIAFPSGCRICSQLLTRADRLPLCTSCLESFQPLPREGCRICGLPWMGAQCTTGAAGELCRECCEGRFSFDAARSFGIYEAALARSVVLLKYETIEPLGVYFAQKLLDVVQREAAQFQSDIIVPVPLHSTRQKERGFNQVDLFGKPLARLLRIPYRSVLLKRNRPRPEKHLLHFDERWEAVRGAFAIREGDRVDNFRILLLDDVMTSGATLDACSRALREAGAKSVRGLTVARAVRPAVPVRESS